MKRITERSKALQVACTVLGHDWHWLLPLDRHQHSLNAPQRHLLVDLAVDKRVCTRCGTRMKTEGPPQPLSKWKAMFPRGALRIAISLNILGASVNLINLVLKHL